MIKQQSRVIRKGDYYQLQTHQQTIMLISKTKKQQQPNPQNSTSNIPVNQQIVTEMPGWGQARGRYFRGEKEEGFGGMGLEELVGELREIAKEEGLRDEERNEIEMLSQEIVEFAQSQELELNSLPTTNNNSTLQSAKQQISSPPHTTITITTHYNVSSITDRLSHLQSLDFPDLLSLQHQLQIMLGDKKPLQSLQLSHMDQKQRQQLTNLYNHLNSLTIMNNTQRTIDSVSMNQAKHVEMQGWLEKMQKIQGLNADFLLELREDKEVLGRLERNFDQNVNVVRGILEELKGNK